MFAIAVAFIALVTINGWISMLTKESHRTTTVRMAVSAVVLIAFATYTNMS